jgi:hypothetical protein
MSSRPARIHVVLVTAALTCCAVLSSSQVTAQQLPAKPKSGTPTENTPTAATRPVASPGIGELTPVSPSALPAERIDGDRATPADLGRLVEWLAYLGAVLYRSGASDSSAVRDLYQQLDAARDETGVFLTRAREGAGPPAQDYARLRSTLARLHERLRTLRGA